MLRAYFDDAGTNSTAPVIAVGGLVGTVDQWEAFDKKWRAKLKEPLESKPPIKSFSLWDCQNAQREFCRYSRPESDLLTKEFREIIIESGVIGFAAAIDKIAWDELVTPQHRQNMGPAENFCLTGCVRSVLAAAKTDFNDEDIALIYDAGRQPHLPERIERFDWSRDLDCPNVISFTWGKVADHTPLQGADMIATESYWFAKDWVLDQLSQPRIHFQDYIKSAQGNGTFMTRELIVEELSRRNPDGTVKDAFRF